MLAELRMVLADPGYRLADRAGHPGSSALGCGCSPSTATTQAVRAGELSDEEVAFGVGLRGAFGVPTGARLVDVVIDLGEASAVGVLCPRVENFARVAECGARQVARPAVVGLPTTAATFVPTSLEAEGRPFDRDPPGTLRAGRVSSRPSTRGVPCPSASPPRSRSG